MKIPKLNAHALHSDDADDFVLAPPQDAPIKDEAVNSAKNESKDAPRPRRKKSALTPPKEADATPAPPTFTLPAPSPTHPNERPKEERQEVGGIEAFVLTHEEQSKVAQDPLALPGRLRGLDDYTGTDAGRQIHYSLRKDKWNGKPTDVVFTDDGERVTVFSNSNENATLAAMQLAAQKWGAIRIDGNAKYVDTCVRLAAEFNIPVSNPDLQDRIQKLRAATDNAVHFSKPKDGVLGKIQSLMS